MVYSVEDRILIKNLYEFKNYGAKTYKRISWKRLDGFWSVKKIEKRWQYDKASGKRTTSQCAH